MRFLATAGVVAGLGLFSLSAQAATILVEAETFSKTGGWVNDPQAMDVMGSPYLLAHGLGEPVADATTVVNAPQAGNYRVWVRTMDWVARWKAPGAPGKFQVKVNGKPLETTFGTEGADWHWQSGGRVQLKQGENELALHDLTGFNGRCDAIVFSDDANFTPPNDLKPMMAWRRQLLGISDKPNEAGNFDLVVVGGGVAGCTSAVSAARLGLKVALIQDRPVLGGNSSSEVQVWIMGKTRQMPYPVLGEIVDEMLTRPKRSPGNPEEYGDAKKLKVVQGEPNISLFLNERAFAVGMEGGKITSVTSRHTSTARETIYRGRFFVDCTGDGTIGYLAGADFEFNKEQHLGSSNMWLPKDSGAPAPFPKQPWMIDLTKRSYPIHLDQLGKWDFESGFNKDTIQEVEAIRDHNLRAMFSTWAAVKNDKKMHPNHKLAWAAYISGKRESRRLLGDVYLKGEDITKRNLFPDSCVSCTWSIDIHYPEPKQAKEAPGEEFMSIAKHGRYEGGPYPIPYRCFYSRNVPNLFMAGRNISVDGVALGPVRVQGTTGMMGEVVGRAAFLAKQHNTTPRGVYEKHLPELIELFKKQLSTVPPPAPKVPFAGWKNPLKDQFGANVARTAKITAPEPMTKGMEKFINDGAITTETNQRWVSKMPLPQTVEFAWDKPQTISAARILTGWAHDGDITDPLSDFELQYHDGNGWKAIPGTKTENNESPEWTAKFAPVSASKVRLVIENAPGSTTRIWEVELLAPK
jgi:hypothetical protein